jgi:hypothetical protein
MQQFLKELPDVNAYTNNKGFTFSAGLSHSYPHLRKSKNSIHWNFAAKSQDWVDR